MIADANTCMLRIRVLGLFFLPTILTYSLIAQEVPDYSFQEISKDADTRYGPSTILLNGEKYNYPYRSARGNPFFEVEGEGDVSIMIDGILYERQKIKYDIYNQHMVLDFLDRSGAPNSIVLRNVWIDFVVLGSNQFKKFSVENGLARFGEVIFEGKYSCIYFWEKELSPNIHQGGETYRFSDPQREAYIQIQGHFYPFSGRKNFIKCFPEPIQYQIKAHLKETRIRIRKATTLQMRSLMEHINVLSDE